MEIPWRKRNFAVLKTIKMKNSLQGYMKPIKKLIGLTLCMMMFGLCGCEAPVQTKPSLPYKAIIVDKTMQEIRNRSLEIEQGKFWYYFRLRPLREDGAIKFDYVTVQVGRYEAEHYQIGDTITIVE